MKKILQFPASRSKRVRSLLKAESQRLFLSMSLMSLVLIAVFSNDQMVKSHRPVYLVSGNDHGPTQSGGINRAVAMAQPLNPLRDLEWEHQLAEKLGSKTEGRNPASLAQNVTLMDDLKYGPLAGKYLIRTLASEPHVNEIEYVDSDNVSDKPVYLGDSRSFLVKYKDLMSVNYANAELSYQTKGQEIWQLVDKQQKIVGRARLSFDGQGHFMSVKFEAL